MFPITCLSIPGIRKKKYHSLCSATALVNNLSLGATSESPAWSPAWWVPCQFRRRGLRKGVGGCWERKEWGEERGGGVWPKPALASSLEYYLLHTAWVSEWGWCLKVEVKSIVISTSSSLFCHPYLLHLSPFNVHYILNTLYGLGRGTWCKNYAARHRWIWLVISALVRTARSLRISS